MSRNLQKEVTNRILAKLKEGVIPWKQPWTGKAFGVMPRNAVTKRAYSGVNVILLWTRAQESGYEIPEWLTFKQALDAGGHVRKGEKSELVIFSSTFEKEVDGETVRIPFLKAFNVFNVAQIDGLNLDEYHPVAVNEDDRIDVADEFLASTGADIRHGEGRAYYQPAADFIMLPSFEAFTSASAYYGAAFHELTHWTNAVDKGRLDRGTRLGRKFGDNAYSAEELVAELGSAFMCAEFGFDNATLDNTAAYIDHWIKFLTDHEGAIVTAAAQASKAVEFLRDLASHEPDGDPEPTETKSSLPAFDAAVPHLTLAYAKSEAKLVCAECRLGPLAGVALYRDKGALFYSGRGIRGKGHLYCLEHAPSAIAKKACELADRLDPVERERLSRNEFVQAQLRPKLEAA